MKKYGTASEDTLSFVTTRFFIQETLKESGIASPHSGSLRTSLAKTRHDGR
jgi:hypothetical protein